jgi:phytol kinase
MNSQLLSLFMFLGILLLLIGIAELMHRSFKLPSELSRKFLHVSGGLMCLLLPRFFTSHWWILALSSLSFLLLLFTYLNNMLRSVHKTKRHSIGSVIFPIPVYLCFLSASLLDNSLFFYIPVSLLTISDTAAEISGNRWGHKSKQFFNGQKTLAGTLAFFITALGVCFGWLFCFKFPVQHIVLATLLLSMTTALAEVFTLKGWDNLTVPVIADIILWIFIH